MEIAPATVEDADAVADLWVALAAEQTDYGSHVLAESNRGVVRDEVTRRAVTDRLIVARTDGAGDSPGEVIGFVMFGVERGSYEMAVTQGIVQNIYVAPDYRNEGVGSDLLAAAERRLDDLGADTVTLETMAGNLQARRFYRRHGYDQHRVELEKSLDTDPTLGTGDRQSTGGRPVDPRRTAGTGGTPGTEAESDTHSKEGE